MLVGFDFIRKLSLIPPAFSLFSCRPVIDEIFYLLADFYFKNKEFRYWIRFRDESLSFVFDLVNFLIQIIEDFFSKFWLVTAISKSMYDVVNLLTETLDDTKFSNF